MEVPSFGRMRDVAAMEDEADRLAFVDARLRQAQNVLHILQLLEMKAHVSCKNHVDDQRTELSELLSRQIL